MISREERRMRSEKPSTECAREVRQLGRFADINDGRSGAKVYKCKH